MQTAKPFDPYGDLELERDATPEQIKKAYYRLSKNYHPDVGGDPEVFQRIARAYEVLSDPDKKKHFDETGFVKGEMNLDMMMNQFIFTLMTQIIQLADPETTDILEALKHEVRAQIKVAQGKFSKLETYFKRLGKTKKKMKSSKGKGILLMLLENEIKVTSHKVQRGQMEIDAMKKSVDLLDEYDYEEVQQRLGFGPSGGSLRYTSTTGGW